MAEPAKHKGPVYDDDSSGQSVTRPDLRALEGQSPSSSTAAGKSWSASDKTSTNGRGDGGATSGTGGKKGLYNSGGDSPSQIKDAEETAGDDDRLGKGYTGNTSSTGGGRRRFRLTKRQTIIGVGSSTLVGVAFSFFSISSGPLQLIHLSEILQKNFHSSNEDSSNRLGKLFRYARSGSLGETRVGKLGSVTFGRTIDQLKDIGVEFQRDGLDHVKSVSIKTEELSKKYPELKNMSEAESKAFLADKFPENIKVDDFKTTGGGKGKYIFEIKVRGTSISFSRAVSKGALSFLENGKILSGVKFRVMAQFLEQPSLFHPIKRFKAIAQDQAAVKVEKKAEADEKARQEAEQQAIKDKAAPDVASLKDKLKSNTKTLVGSALVGQAMLCIVRSVADDVVKVNRAAIVLPTVAQATDKIAVGEQVKSGQDISAEQAGGVVDNFKDKDGKTIWQSKALQATAGMPQTGKDLPADFQQAFSNNTTAQSIKDTVGSPKLAGVDIGAAACSKIGIAVGLAIGVGQLLSSAVAALPSGGLSVAAEISYITAKQVAVAGALYALQHAFTNLLSDKAIVPDVLSGPLGGNLLAYGARETANTGARASGGVPLSNSDTALLDRQEELASQQKFRSESFFARMFDAKDYRSLTGRLADSINPNLAQNVASLTNGFMNIGSMLPHAFSAFIPKAHAANKPYNWGFSKVGIPSEVMNDSNMENPYDNADQVAKVLDASCTNSDGTTDSSCDPISKAKTCFGVDVNKDSGEWDATPTEPVNPNSDEYASANCGDTGNSNSNWKRMILFVFDTSTMKAAACYDGDDQACKDVGYSSGTSGGNASTPDATSSSDSSTGGTVASGSGKELAKKILSLKDAGKVTCDDGTCADIQSVANGQDLAVGQGCKYTKTLDPKVLKLILYVVDAGNFTIRISALCSNHHDDGPNGHSGGKAMDIASVNGVRVDSPDGREPTLKMAKFLSGLQGELRPRQLITDGYANQHDGAFTALEINGSSTGSAAAAAFAGDNPAHRNHIHVGY